MSPIGAAVIALAILTVVGIVAVAYRGKWSWTGFVGTRSTKPPERKTLWNWLELLIVPLALAGIGLSVNARDNRQQRQRADADQALAATLAARTRSTPISHRCPSCCAETGSSGRPPGSEVAVLARTLTLTALRRLDGARKGEVVRFLAEARLVRSPRPIIDLRDADLTHVALRDARLDNVSAANADIRAADFSGAQLEDASFAGADLRRARFVASDLRRSDFSRGDLRGADFPDAWIFSVSFAKSCLTGTNFRGATLGADASRNIIGGELTNFAGALGHHVDMRFRSSSGVSFGESGDDSAALLWDVKLPPQQSSGLPPMNELPRLPRSVRVPGPDDYRCAELRHDGPRESHPHLRPLFEYQDPDIPNRIQTLPARSCARQGPLQRRERSHTGAPATTSQTLQAPTRIATGACLVFVYQRR